MSKTHWYVHVAAASLCAVLIVVRSAYADSCSGGSNDEATCTVASDCPGGTCTYVALIAHPQPIAPGFSPRLATLGGSLTLDRDGFVQVVPIDRALVTMVIDAQPTGAYYRFRPEGNVSFGAFSLGAFSFPGAQIEITDGEGALDFATNELSARINFTVASKSFVGFRLAFSGTAYASGHMDSVSGGNGPLDRISLRSDGEVLTQPVRVPIMTTPAVLVLMSLIALTGGWLLRQRRLRESTVGA